MRRDTERRSTRRPAIPTAALLALAVAAPGASAAEDGSTTGTVTVAADVRSITVSPGAVPLDAPCYDAANRDTGRVLILPHGTCQSNTTQWIRVTNTGAPGHVVMSASAVQGTESDTPWTLCDGPLGPACPTSGPGVDQARLDVHNEWLGLVTLGSVPATDTSFGSTGPNAERGEMHSYARLRLRAPSRSTSNPPTRSFTVTWQAMPWVGAS